MGTSVLTENERLLLGRRIARVARCLDRLYAKYTESPSLAWEKREGQLLGCLDLAICKLLQDSAKRN